MQTEEPCANLTTGRMLALWVMALCPPPQASAVPEQSLTSDPGIQDTLGLSWLQNWVVRRWGAASQDSC